MRSQPSLLDVGCGRLGVAAFLPHTKVVGSDVLPPTETAKHFTFVSGDATALPFQDRAFPAVSCVDVLEHLPPEARGQVIRECVRVASRTILIAFPSGERSRRFDLEYRQACANRRRPVPDWLEEHLRYEYPIAEQVADQVRRTAAQSGRRVSLTQFPCESLRVSRVVRAAASRSAFLYAIVNCAYGLSIRLIPTPHPAHSYRTILVAGLSSA